MIDMPAQIDVPLRIDDHGKIRIGQTRVLLELVIRAFNRGETPEEIVDSYSTLTLSDVYAVIAYYLAHQSDVDQYVALADQAVDALQRQVESAYSPAMLALREKLAKRKAQHSE